MYLQLIPSHIKAGTPEALEYYKNIASLSLAMKQPGQGIIIFNEYL